MQIIILGAGTVGSTLAENLSAENHDITLVDINANRLQDLQSRLDIRTIHGNGSYPAILRAAGAESADMLIAVTDMDEVNMIACQVAYSLFHTPQKIARVRSPHYFIRKELFGDENLPIDKFINPEHLLINHIIQLITYPGALHVVEFVNGEVKLVTVKLIYSSPLVGKTLKQISELMPEIEMRIVAVFRSDRLISLAQEVIFEVGDEIFFVAAKKYIKKIVETVTQIEKSYNHILIGGGGAVGLGLAEALEDNYQIKIIDRSRARCKLLSQKLQKSTVLLGDVTDKELLVNEDAENIDVYCAVTDDDENNIMSCMLNKRLGVKLVMALVQRPAYIDLIEDSGINIALSPKLTTTNGILTYIRQGDVVSVFSLRRGAAEAIEAVAHGDSTTSKVIGRKIYQIELPRSVIVGAIVRDEKVIIPTGDTTIESEDHVIMFVADKLAIEKVEKLFIEEKRI